MLKEEKEAGAGERRDFFFFNCWLHFGKVEGSLTGREGEEGEKASKAACQQVAAV